ncbi:restriction endonuclease subunit S [Maribellus sp. YY47]|uniref:restriction endonuclease subunit S n=1 Tax=Maribellus sp. YY47 TaxID=2929486 RepID=UPI002001642C|nr:restriction endonuclease subunit S [Maribellus sp. YY47]
MSKIEELIQQYCPDGAEFIELQEVFEIKNGYTPSKANSEFWTNGTIPWFRMEDIRQNGHILSDSIQHITPEAVKGSGLFPANSIIVATTATIGEHALIIVDSLANQRFTFLSKRKSFDDKLDMKFFHYYMFIIDEWCKNNTNTASFPSVDMGRFKKYKFPIPPLPIQQEIVAILDKFTTLEAELEAELEARRAQYIYYRDQLLCFDGKDVEWKMLGEVGEFIRGKRFVKNDIVSEGVPCIHYGELYTHYKIWAKEAKSYLNPNLAAKLRVAHPGDVVIVSAGETIEDIGNGVAWLGDSDVVIHDACFAYSHKMNPKYVSYYLQTNLFRSQIKSSISSGKISSINAPGLSKAKIPIPPMEEQVRIVGILDKFDALVNDISVGLPAEIEARRKQYEYYRSKLLSFEPVVSE